MLFFISSCALHARRITGWPTNNLIVCHDIEHEYSQPQHEIINRNIAELLQNRQHAHCTNSLFGPNLAYDSGPVVCAYSLNFNLDRCTVSPMQGKKLQKYRSFDQICRIWRLLCPPTYRSKPNLARDSRLIYAYVPNFI